MFSVINQTLYQLRVITISLQWIYHQMGAHWLQQMKVNIISRIFSFPGIAFDNLCIIIN